MGSTSKLIVFSLLIGLGILGGAVFYAKQGGGPATSAQGEAFPPQPDPEKVTLPEDMALCGGQEQCIVVETRCDFCCDYEPINAKYERTFDVLFDRHCGSFQGQSCDCFDLDRYPACEAGKCVLKEWPNAGP